MHIVQLHGVVVSDFFASGTDLISILSSVVVVVILLLVGATSSERPKAASSQIGSGLKGRIFRFHVSDVTHS